MSHYYNLRFKINLNPIYTPYIRKVVEEVEWEESDVEFFRDFGFSEHSQHIGFGFLREAPDNWSSFEWNGLLGHEWSYCLSIYERHYRALVEFVNQILGKVSTDIISMELHHERYETLHVIRSYDDLALELGK